MAGQNDEPPRWENRKQRTQRLTSKELSAKLETTLLSDELDEDSIQSEQPGVKKKNATARSSAKRVATVVSKFCALKKKILQSIGFEGILQWPQINKMDRQFTVWLLSRIDCDKRTLAVNPNCTIELRDIDVQRVLGIPCGKRPVCGIGSEDPEDKIDFIRLYIGTGGVEQYDSLMAAEHNIVREYPDGMSQCEVEQFKVSFVVFLACRFLAPTAHSNTGSKNFWGALYKSDEIASFNWCAYALDTLIGAARKVQYDIAMKKDVSNVGGCPLFIQVLFLDYIQFGGINKPGCRLPRVADYGCEIMNKLIQAYKNKTSSNGKDKALMNCSGSPSVPIQVQGDMSGDDKEVHKNGTPFAAMQQETYTLPSFLQAVSTAKMAITHKVALKWHMAQMLKHINAHKNAILRDGIILVQKLSAQGAHDEQGSLERAPERIVSNKRTADGYVSGCESASEATSGPRMKSKRRIDEAGPSSTRQHNAINEDSTPGGTLKYTSGIFDCPTFDLGIEGVDSERKATINPSDSKLTMLNTPIQSQGNNHVISLDGDADEDKFITPLQPLTSKSSTYYCEELPIYPNCKPLSPSTALSLEPPPFVLYDTNTSPEKSSTKQNQMDQAATPIQLDCMTPAQQSKSGSTGSPGTLNGLYSETAVLYRIFSLDTDINLNGKSLTYDFTDSPVTKRKCLGGKLVKSPWSQELTHPKRDVVLTSTFFKWLSGTTSPETSRYAEASGDDLKEMLCAKRPFTYDLFDLSVRRLIQLDNIMYTKRNMQRWRHVFESDFAMLVLAGEQAANNISIRHQFIGSHVKHAIELCRMIIVPVLVRETWCSYFWDMKLKCVHVLDPLFKPEEASVYEEIHKPNVHKLQDALSCCLKEFMEGWCPDWKHWKNMYVQPMIPNAEIAESGLMSLIAIRDFNGIKFANDQNKVTLSNFQESILHEVLCLSNNNAKLPGNFVLSIDDC